MCTVYDASVKVPTGIEYGSVYQFGNFDQCMTSATLRSNTIAHPKHRNGNEYDTDDAVDSDDTTTTTVAYHHANRNGPAGNAGAVQPKYCLADVTMDGYSVRSGAVRHFEVSSSTFAFESFRDFGLIVCCRDSVIVFFFSSLYVNTNWNMIKRRQSLRVIIRIFRKDQSMSAVCDCSLMMLKFEKKTKQNR